MAAFLRSPHRHDGQQANELLINNHDSFVMQMPVVSITIVLRSKRKK